jgi:antitoxin (DNA-binding transcriptional repressor) of toxin-antitoxin stability system
MAVIHISEEEAARSLPDLIARVQAGERVLIDGGSGSVSLVPADESPKRRTTSAAVRRSEAHGASVTLDDAFADDMEEIMRFNRQERPDPWESS